MGGYALPEGEPDTAGNCGESRGKPDHCKQVDQVGNVGTTEGRADPDKGRTDQSSVSAGGGDKPGIKDREEGKRYATSKEADVLIKLSSAIKKMETESGIADIIGVGMRFIEFLRPVNLELAKDVTRMFDLFVKSSIKQ